MAVSLILEASLAESLQALTCLEVESAGVLLARAVRTPDGDLRLLGHSYHPVADEAYERRERRGLSIRPEGYLPALSAAEAAGAVPIWLHTHPGDDASPELSAHDRQVDEQLTELFRWRADSPYYGALVLGHSGSALTFTGHLDDAQSSQPIDRLLTVGERWSLRPAYDKQVLPVPSLFDRHIRAFGGEVQHILSDLRVVIIGCGGTGSAVAEQLVRLGVRHFQLVDADRLSESNLTRVYGATPDAVGRPKVDVLSDHLRRIAPDVTVKKSPSMVTLEPTARQLVGADVLFGCTDDNAGRLVLSKFSTYMLTPLIDCGVVLTSDEHGRLEGIHGRVTVLHPGAACLVCRGRIDIARASSELLTPAERQRRVDEGYAPALAGIEPAVVAYTTAVAAAAVGELLERLIGYGPEPVPQETLLRLHERELSTNRQAPTEHHYCHPGTGKIGLGETANFLEMTWPKQQ